MHAQAASLARSLVLDHPAADGESSAACSSERSSSQVATHAATSIADASAASSSSADAACSPVRVSLRVRSLRLPRLYAPEEVASENSAHVVLCGSTMLEQLSNSVPRRYGDTGGEWHLLFSTYRDGTSLAHLLRRCARCTHGCTINLHGCVLLQAHPSQHAAFSLGLSVAHGLQRCGAASQPRDSRES